MEAECCGQPSKMVGATGVACIRHRVAYQRSSCCNNPNGSFDLSLSDSTGGCDLTAAIAKVNDCGQVFASAVQTAAVATPATICPAAQTYITCAQSTNCCSTSPLDAIVQQVTDAYGSLCVGPFALTNTCNSTLQRDNNTLQWGNGTLVSGNSSAAFAGGNGTLVSGGVNSSAAFAGANGTIVSAGGNIVGCDVTAVTACGETFQSAATAAGTNFAAICTAAQAYGTCVQTSSCCSVLRSQIQSIFDQYGQVCTGSNAVANPC